MDKSFRFTISNTEPNPIIKNGPRILSQKTSYLLRVTELNPHSNLEV